MIYQKKKYNMRPRNKVNYLDLDVPSHGDQRFRKSSGAGVSQMQQHEELRIEEEQEQLSEFDIRPINLECILRDEAQLQPMDDTDHRRGLFGSTGGRDSYSASQEYFFYDEGEEVNSSFDTEEFLDDYYKATPYAFKLCLKHANSRTA